MKTVKILLVSVMVGGVFAAVANGQALREKFIERMKEKSVRPTVDPSTIVPGATLKTFTYGTGPAEAIDVYAPPNAHGAPVIVMVHGGGWRIGDKSSPGVVGNKMTHWLPQGYILVSVNYGLLPDVKVDAQAVSIAKAVANAETHAADWGGDGNKLILMGHSAGAHLVALMSADPSQVAAQGGHAWRGTVVLDSAALDVASVMGKKHPQLYDDAFGSDPAYWAQLSPSVRLKPDAVPMLLVCSTTRPDDSCGQSRAFAAKVKAAGMEAPVQPEVLTHMQIDDNLGKPGAYTDVVDAFIAARLKSP
jgi:acetyl esterase/lipase